MGSIGVVIAAGGRGKRFGGSTPKQLLRLAGIPILQRSVELFESIASIEEIVVVCPSGQVARVEKLLGRMGSRKIVTLVVGGKERQDSVWNGLNAFVGQPDIVLVHDAARPLVSRRTISSVISSTIRYQAAVVGVRVADTIKVEGGRGFYVRTLDRGKLWAVQTPQGFRFDLLMEAHKAAQRSGYQGTDEASLVERLKIPVRIVEGDSRNMKITTPEDLRLAEMLLKKGRTD